MDTLEAIKRRRACRYFIEKEVPDKDIEIILDAARYAHSELNCQPLELIVVKDEEGKQFIHDGIMSAWNVEQGCFDGGDIYAGIQEYPSTQNIPRNDEFTPEDLYRPTAMVIVASDEEKRETTPYSSDEYFSVASDAASAAIMNMMLVARTLDVGTVWLTFPDSVALKWRFGIPKMMGIAGIVPLGYPDKWMDVPEVVGKWDERFWPRRPIESMTHYGKFDEDKWQKNTRNIFGYGPVVGKDRFLQSKL